MRSLLFAYEKQEEKHIVPKLRMRTCMQQRCIWSFKHKDSLGMEPQRNGTLNETHSPELPPPHLLLELSSGANPQTNDCHEQNGTQVSLKTDRDVGSSVFDKPDATCDDVSDISSAPSAPTPRSREPTKSAPSETPDDNGEVVERRRRRVPSTPRPTSGIPRLSAGEPIRRSTRTASESRQRPKSEITRNSSESVSRSSNFGWNRRPNSALHQRSQTDPSNNSYGASRSRNSSSSSYQSSGGGRRMEIRSKIGSLDNAKHKPGGGNVKIFNEKKDLSKVSSKCGSLDYTSHKPGGGNVQITDEKVKFRQTAASKVGSMDNAKHRAGGGDVKIDNQKLKWEVKSKVGSLDNAKHKAGGGDKKIETVKVDFRDRASSKVGSMDNAKHMPGGGDKKIFSEVLPWSEPPKQSQQIHSQPLNFKQSAQPKVGSFDNVNHNPSGGEIEIFKENLPWLKHNKPNLSPEEKQRIMKKGGYENSGAFDREKQRRYDFKVKGKDYSSSSRASTTESYGFGSDTEETHRPKKPRHSTAEVRTSIQIVNSNNSALSPVNESNETDGNNNKRKTNEIAFTSIDEVEDTTAGREIDGRYANGNQRNNAIKGNNSTVNASSSRRLRASDKYAKQTHGENSSEPRENKVGDNAGGKQQGASRERASERKLETDNSTAVMPTSSTAKIEKSKGAGASDRRSPSYTSTRSRRGNDKSTSPRKIDQTIGARRSNDEQPHVVFPTDEDIPIPRANDESDPWELVNETWEHQAHQKTSEFTSNKENRRPARKENKRGVKDLYRTEGYAERFKLLPIRPEDETPQPIRLSPLLVEPKKNPSPEWKKKAQLKIDFDKDGNEITLKTNLKPSTKLPRVAGMAEEDKHDGKGESYSGHFVRAQKSPRREKKPHKINSDRLENILPSINQLLDIKDPPSKVYSLYTNQSSQKAIPRRRIHYPEKTDNSAELKTIRDEFYDEFLQEAAKQFEPKPRKDPLNNAEPDLNILQQNISDYNKEIDENRLAEQLHHEALDSYEDYFPDRMNENAFYIPDADYSMKPNEFDRDFYNDADFFPSSQRFDQLTVEAPALDMPRASAAEFNDQLPPLPINFGKSDAGSATTVSSSISIQDNFSGRGSKKRSDFLKWKPGEVPFDKRSSNKMYYSSVSPPQQTKTMRKRNEGFANRFSLQKIWYDDYNYRMRNRQVAEKINNRTLDNSTFELVD